MIDVSSFFQLLSLNWVVILSVCSSDSPFALDSSNAFFTKKLDTAKSLLNSFENSNRTRRCKEIQW